MFSNFKSSLANLFHNFHHFNNMQTPIQRSWYQPVISSVSEHITAYCQKLEAIKNSIGTDWLGHLIVALYGFKTSALSWHKYAQANVATPNAKKTIPLAFERMLGKTFDIDTTPLKSQNPKLEILTLDYPNPITHSGSNCSKLTAQLALSSRSLLTSLTSLSRSSLTSASAFLSFQCFADDRVTPLPPSERWASDDRHLFTLTFNLKPLYLYKLPLLVKVDHPPREPILQTPVKQLLPFPWNNCVDTETNTLHSGAAG